MPATTGKLQFQRCIAVSVQYVTCISSVTQHPRARGACNSTTLLTTPLYQGCFLAVKSSEASTIKKIRSCTYILSVSGYFVSKYTYENEPWGAYDFTKHQANTWLLKRMHSFFKYSLWASTPQKRQQRLGEKFLQKFISSRDGPIKSTQGRDENR